MMNRNRTHDPEKKGSRRRLDSGQKNASKVSEADDDFKIEGESRIRFGVEDDDDSFVINAGDSNPGSKRPELSGSQKPLSQRVM